MCVEGANLMLVVHALLSDGLSSWLWVMPAGAPCEHSRAEGPHVQWRDDAPISFHLCLCIRRAACSGTHMIHCAAALGKMLCSSGNSSGNMK